MRFPLVVIFAIVAFNITIFTLMLQMDILIFHSPIFKAISWLCTIGAWVLTYTNRNKFTKPF